MPISSKPRKQRYRRWHAPFHRRRRRIAAPLSPDLRRKYGLVKRIPVRKGDTVQIMRGSYRGEKGKVIEVDLTDHQITIEGQILTKADGKQKPRRFPSSNLMIVKLILGDNKRREILRRKGVGDVDLEEEEEEEASDEGDEEEEEEKESDDTDESDDEKEKDDEGGDAESDSAAEDKGK